MNSLEYSGCPQCGAVSHHIEYDRFHPYMVVRCRLCKFHYLCPRLSESAIQSSYKDNDYFYSHNYGYLDYSDQEAALRVTFRRLLKNLFARNLTGGALLEVGCGFGFFLHEAAEYFDYRVGTDYSYLAVAEAGKYANKILHGGVDSLDRNESFDLIVAIQVIEHVYRPKDFILKLTGHLKKGGKLVLATPDMGSFWRKTLGHYWPSFKIPEHVSFYDRQSLKRTMEMCGLVDIQFLPYPHAFPISLILSKFTLNLSKKLTNHYLWLPKTTIAAFGNKNV